MGPSYVNLSVSFIGELISEQFSGPKPEFFGRCIDDFDRINRISNFV